MLLRADNNLQRWQKDAVAYKLDELRDYIFANHDGTTGEQAHAEVEEVYRVLLFTRLSARGIISPNDLINIPDVSQAGDVLAYVIFRARTDLSGIPDQDTLPYWSQVQTALHTLKWQGDESVAVDYLRECGVAPDDYFNEAIITKVQKALKKTSSRARTAQSRGNSSGDGGQAQT